MFAVHSNATGPKRTPHTFLFGTGKAREPKKTNLTVFRGRTPKVRCGPAGQNTATAPIFFHPTRSRKTKQLSTLVKTTAPPGWPHTHTHAHVQQDPNGTCEQQFWRVGGRYHSGLSPRRNERRGTDTMALQMSVRTHLQTKTAVRCRARRERTSPPRNGQTGRVDTHQPQPRLV